MVERTLMAYELDDPFAALISSSAKHSAMDLTLRNADSRVYKDRMIRVNLSRKINRATYAGGEEGNGLVHSAEW